MANPLCSGRKLTAKIPVTLKQTNQVALFVQSGDLLHDSNRTAVTILPMHIDPHRAGARGQIVR